MPKMQVYDSQKRITIPRDSPSVQDIQENPEIKVPNYLVEVLSF